MGDYVSYATMIGHSARLRFGVVTRLAERSHRWNGKSVPTLRVIAADWQQYSRPSGTWSTGGAPLKNGGEVTLGELERVVVLGRSNMPRALLEVLDAALAKFRASVVKK